MRAMVIALRHFQGEPSTELAQGQRGTIRGLARLAPYRGTVSYTHLDVYKRQVGVLPPRTRLQRGSSLTLTTGQCRTGGRRWESVRTDHARRRSNCEGFTSVTTCSCRSRHLPGRRSQPRGVLKSTVSAIRSTIRASAGGLPSWFELVGAVRDDLSGAAACRSCRTFAVR